MEEILFYLIFDSLLVKFKMTVLWNAGFTRKFCTSLVIVDASSYFK